MIPSRSMTPKVPPTVMVMNSRGATAWKPLEKAATSCMGPTGVLSTWWKLLGSTTWRPLTGSVTIS